MKTILESMLNKFDKVFNNNVYFFQQRFETIKI